ncbi:WD40 repeat-like protein [Aureobasidium pullulans]|nr:WD40 repeat-like protein [Aureobasidium pullulans]
MPSMNRHQFLAEFVYGVEKYFDVGGIQASWAKGSKPAHRFWGDEDDRIEIPSSSDDHTTSDFAVSPDEKLVAVCGGLLISVYDIATKECRTQFRCPDESFPKLRFYDLARGDGGFCLIVATSDRPAMNNKLVMVELDNNGHMLTGQANILITPNLIDQSLAPIVSRVNYVYVTPNTVPRPLLDEVRAKYTRALEHLQAKLLFESFEQIDGRFSGSQASSKDGRLLLYTINNHTTQRVSRAADGLPKIIVYDFVKKCQMQILSGHEDSVTWTAFSPDDSHIASASWDGTYRIFDTVTGECKHTIGPIGGQCTSGAWSPDSKHVVVCGSGRRTEEDTGTVESYSMVAVFSTATGKEVARFWHEDPKSRPGQVAWSSRNEIALTRRYDADTWIWNPFEDRITSSLSLKVENPMMRAYVSPGKVAWARDGKLLILMCGDGTVEVWDRDANVKWTFQKPVGLDTKRFGQSFTWLEQHRMLMILNGDGYLRFYKLD